ncbi:MAG: FtsW/RodA/SpoVE family cell cycle protein [Oscillospiraceae bacterium]|nr:FtsW/RodA/SpoVE family cell cycle protein [Oscillospiraceae bacterium]
MKRFRNLLWNVFHKGDMVLLTLCVIVSVFGIVMIYAVMGEEGSRNMTVQIGTVIGGIVLYLAFTAFDIEILAGQRTLLFLFNVGFIGLLLIWGVEGDSGNRSWLQIPFLPFNIQPAEVCKITYTIILAKTMSVNQTRISSPRTVMTLVLHALFIAAFNLIISRDMGVTLIYLFIFLAVTYIGGVKIYWFGLGFLITALLAPVLWEYGFAGYQKNRIMALFDDSIDPTGWGVLWHTTMNLKTLRTGGLTGLGLFNGRYSDSSLPARHTDSIFCGVGEQLGLLGCLVLLLLLLAIVARILYIGMKTPDYMNHLICIGMASMLLFQILINVGVCLGLVPVIGLTLPFVSYGGSSMLTSFVAMGIVSGIKMRPAPDMNAHYIRSY